MKTLIAILLMASVYVACTKKEESVPETTPPAVTEGTPADPHGHEGHDHQANPHDVPPPPAEQGK